VREKSQNQPLLAFSGSKVERKKEKSMKKDEWEKEHKYGKSEYTCAWCKHSKLHRIDPWINTYTCEEKRRAGVGSSIPASYQCDMWEHK
jgi:hypothetical protein